MCDDRGVCSILSVFGKYFNISVLEISTRLRAIVNRQIKENSFLPNYPKKKSPEGSILIHSR